jgi:tetratricopeptide (TPR) repeat protein
VGFATVPERSGLRGLLQTAGSGSGDPDALYRDRSNLQAAGKAAAIWADRLARDPKDFEAAWKLARACYWLGGHIEADARRREFERGLSAARQAIALEPDRPEGHFWLAADLGGLAEASGWLAGLRSRTQIRGELERVLAIDPSYLEGSADRALGRWYFEVPGLFGGSNAKSEAHLRRSFSYDPDNIASHFFLAETLLGMGRTSEARAELQRVLDAPVDPDWEPEDQEFKRDAERLLKTLR